MHNKSQERCHVRHVPIHIEPREELSQNVHSDGQNQDKSHRHMYGNRTQSQTLPKTSSININYRPSPNRPSADQSSSSSYLSSHHEPNSLPRPHSADSRESNDQFNHRDNRSASPSKISSNSDKLISSPEPIPLPPPPCDPNQKSKMDPSCVRSNNSNDETKNRSQDQNVQIRPGREANMANAIAEVKTEVTRLLQEISKFNGTSAKSKDFRYLDEMLTRCIIRLDNIECGDSLDLRQQRKAAIKLIQRAADILQRKLQINLDISELSESMAVANS